MLREFAAIIKKETRNVDFAARYGGDEFVLLLPETDLTGAVVLAKRIKGALSETDGFKSSIEELNSEIIEIDEIVKLGCSIGISGVFPGDNISSAITRADESLQEAKRSGKNCFIVWEEK